MPDSLPSCSESHASRKPPSGKVATECIDDRGHEFPRHDERRIGKPMVHDCAITERYVVLFDLPCTFDVNVALEGAFPYVWNPDYGARVGLLPRDGEASQVRWLEVPLCYVFHPLNAYETADGRVVLDVCRHPKMFAKDRLGVGPIYKHDLVKRASQVRLEGNGRAYLEPVFVPRTPESDEDDGWLLAYVYDAPTNGGEVQILHAQDFGGSPVATIHLPQRVPFGFHGNWVPAGK